MQRIEINSKIIITFYPFPVGRKAIQKELAAAILHLEQHLNEMEPLNQTNIRLYTRFHFDLSEEFKNIDNEEEGARSNA